MVKLPCTLAQIVIFEADIILASVGALLLQRFKHSEFSHLRKSHSAARLLVPCFLQYVFFYQVPKTRV